MKLRSQLNHRASQDIKWPDVVSLIRALSGVVVEGSGSRTRFDLHDVSLNIHSPHSPPELKIYQVKAVRDFLTQAGITQ